MTTVQLLSQDAYLTKNVKKALTDLPVRALPDCRSMRDLIESFKSDRPDMVILDSLIAGLTVIEVIKKLKQIDEGLVIVLITKVKNAAFVDRAFRYGVSDILQVPYSEPFFQQTILHRCEIIKDSKLVHFNNNV